MEKFSEDDTIAAIATPVGEGGIAVIRISGEKAFEIADKIFVSNDNKTLLSKKTHTIAFGEIRDNKKTVDQVCALLFKSPHSYTGEDVVEISCHGGVAVTRKILKLLLSSGARLAGAGEFTRRAFLNGKIDLTQAEAVLDLVCAKSEGAAKVAARQLTGETSAKLIEIKKDVLELFAHLETLIDFPEEDMGVDERDALKNRFLNLQKKVASLRERFFRDSVLREGVRASLVGRPNVGKSSIFNAFLSRDRALVSPLPHTTRDTIEEPVEIGGFYVRLSDTAGLVPSSDNELEKMGMARTGKSVNESDMIFFVVDGSERVTEEDKFVFDFLKDRKFVFVLANKADISGGLYDKEIKKLAGNRPLFYVSAKTLQGFSDVERSVIKVLENQHAGISENSSQTRHQETMKVVSEAISDAENAFDRNESPEFATVYLKKAVNALGELTGEIYTDDLLDVIFSKFCIGK